MASSFPLTPAVQPRRSNKQGITEIVLPSTPDNDYAFILPMLAHLSRQCEDRWFTWIAPRGINRKRLADYGFALEKMRIIYTRDESETRWVLWDALAMGNSATVVVSYESLSKDEIAKLELAAQRGDCQGLLLRHRKDSW